MTADPVATQLIRSTRRRHQPVGGRAVAILLPGMLKSIPVGGGSVDRR
jgi:hypothetical protein